MTPEQQERICDAVERWIDPFILAVIPVVIFILAGLAGQVWSVL